MTEAEQASPKPSASAAMEIAALSQRILALAPIAGLYIGIKITNAPAKNLPAE